MPRLKAYTIDEDVLWILLNWAQGAPDVLAIPEPFCGLPKSATFLYAYPDQRRRSIVAVFSDESFDETPSGAAIPLANDKFSCAARRVHIIKGFDVFDPTVLDSTILRKVRDAAIWELAKRELDGSEIARIEHLTSIELGPEDAATVRKWERVLTGECTCLVEALMSAGCQCGAMLDLPHELTAAAAAERAFGSRTEANVRIVNPGTYRTPDGLEISSESATWGEVGDALADLRAAAPHTCKCSTDVLMSAGCQCGAIAKS